MSAFMITQENFEEEVLKAQQPVLVDFWAPWCGPCRTMSPTVDEVAEEAADIRVGKLNVQDYPDLARTYRVMSIPTLALFKEGKVVASTVGVQSKEDILRMIQK